MHLASKLSLILFTLFEIIFSIEQFLVHYIEKSEKLFGHHYEYPPYIQNNSCCKRFCTLFLKTFGDVNMDEDEEFSIELTSSDIIL